MKFENGYILYDEALISNPHVHLFQPEWLQRQGNLQLIGHGRGEAWLVDYMEKHWLLRHYMRGGLVAKINQYHYLGWRLNYTRAWKEWQLTYRLYQKGLPVPRPVAAQVFWPWGRVSGLYQAYLLVEKIQGAETLSQRLQKSVLGEFDWQRLGRLIAQFHQQGVYHADLNANNILFDDQDDIYLIDFDRGEIRPSGIWKQHTIQRLRRSLDKLQGLHQVFNFSDPCWHWLLQGYGLAQHD